MKKFMKKLIPFLLVLLILASLVWYGFVYDRNFTRDLLLSQARLYSTNGNQKLASWFYDLAYMHSGQDEGVAIELANQFKSAGNYTKAEVTLSDAIADGGSVELYIALCKTYVEQDKLLDAVAMLDQVRDSAVKQQLDEMRPAAPTATPEAGFYSQYISVGLDAKSETIYYTTDGEYPSTDDIPYSEPFTLAAGETNVQAVAVADNGLVSPLFLANFTVGGVIEPVTFEDAAIEAEIRALLEVDEDHVVYTNELWTITSFTVPEAAENLNDLGKLSYLESLTIADRDILTLQFLNPLSYLEELSMTDCRFSPDEVTIIASLPELRSLTMTDCGISTIAGLEKAQRLEALNLSENAIRTLDPLSAIFTLRSINLSHNALTGLGALSTLSNLEMLDVSYNSISSIAPIAACVKLAWLDVSSNSLTSLGGIDNLTALTHLSANHNALSDVEILGNCTALVELDIGNNAVTDIRALGNLTKLELLDFAYNQVKDLPAFPDGSALRTIDGSHNAVNSVYNLRNLMELSHVYFDYNEITDLSHLAKCYKLVMVNVYGNKVYNVDMLTDLDIIVNYDPTE